MSKHTPEPWIEESYSGEGGSVITGDGRQIVAIVYGRTPEERRANARLIAATSDLLRIAKGAQSALRSYQYGNGSTDLAEDIANALEREIAKAEGRA